MFDQETVTGTTHTIRSHDGGSLIEEVTYQLRVSAANAVGLSSWSDVVSARVPSREALLESLVVSPVNINEFHAETTSYAIIVSTAVAQMTVTAVTVDGNATMTFGPAPDADPLAPGHQIALRPGGSAVEVRVMAEDGVTARTYTIIITQVTGNNAPTVYVTPDMAIINGCNAVLLNGTSGDPENDTLSYYWTASPDIGHFADETKEDTVWSAPAAIDSPQTVTLTLTVTDSRGEAVTESVIVTVRPKTH